MVDIKSLLETLQEKTGLTEEKAKKLLGATLSFAKQHGIPIPAAAQKYVDDAEAQNQTNKDAGEHGDLVDNAIGFLGSLNLGNDHTKSRAAGDDAPSTATTNGGEVDSLAELLGLLKKFNIDPQQALAALPTIVKLLKDQGVDVSPIVNLIPGANTATSDSSAAAAPAPAAAAASPAPAAATPAPAPADSGDATKELVNSVMGKASGFLGSFGKK